MLILTLSTALAGPRLDFPEAAPQSGDTEGCPSVDVLSRRFKTQSDANGGGFGYYPAKYDDRRVPHVVPPSEQYVADYLAGKKSGSLTPPSDDESLRLFWGTRCAFPDLPYVEDALNELRRRYVARTGVTMETERRYHSRW